ncbi:hypothetical protein LOY46_17890 [Pseudomonas sichuanensis]|uniref:hypothetical protein n=1 Tax=Pseudomonas sichuanensis TaxID=2213015 RepID=UPI00215E0528|nr:hypothetical protein [Pseudomonas sichuanensis]UVK81431.1 hypothetical protein LOY46_17890 [Pseudomonas sichuanensis]
MTIYTELQNRFEAREAALAKQVYLLSKAAAGLSDNFGKYLGLPSPRWNYPDGKAGDYYVRFGVGERSSFEEKPWTQMSSLDGVVSFSMALTLISEDRFARTIFVFPMSVEFFDTGYLFKLNEGEQVLISVADVQSGAFDEVYSKMVARLGRILDPSQVLINN